MEVFMLEDYYVEPSAILNCADFSRRLSEVAKTLDAISGT